MGNVIARISYTLCRLRITAQYVKIPTLGSRSVVLVTHRLLGTSKEPRTDPSVALSLRLQWLIRQNWGTNDWQLKVM